MTKTADIAEQLDPADIAVVGIAGRFPGTPTLDDFWQAIDQGRETISLFTDEELAAGGVGREISSQKDYVKAAGFLEGSDLFDAGYFGYAPGEAEFIDPQQRLFLECAVEALEDAGCDPARFAGSIGVFAGAGISTYQLDLAMANRDAGREWGPRRTMITLGTDKDYLATRLSYKLNLKGPSVAIQTACSTSLVAVHFACQSLLANECDAAIAGGVSVMHGPRKTGYIYSEGGILSPDGHCRPFDAKAQGTVFGDGVGIVVLKRLADAVAQGDQIYAVIRGSATNNDGSSKVGFTAPSVDGQAAAIAEALSVAGVDPATVGFIETHGTGTALGDPIEIAALKEVYAEISSSAKKIVIGSLKANIGHLNTAAGIAGLIKTILVLKHRRFPPNVNFSSPNPQIDFAATPFRVLAEAEAWPSDAIPRRAAISSFGVGGTNAHMVLEEAPPRASDERDTKSALLVVSAKSATALDASTTRLLAHLDARPELDLGDVSFTLRAGRTGHEHRRAVLYDAARPPNENQPRPIWTGRTDPFHRPLYMMFPGQGTQYVNMSRGLYRTQPAFRSELDRCFEAAAPHLDRNLRDAIFTDGEREGAEDVLSQTAMAQPAIFSISYAIARFWEKLGIVPAAMIGHSVGEYVAACLAGVFSLDDALMLLAARGQLMQALPKGSMLALPVPANSLPSDLADDVSVAAENGASACVISGPRDAIDRAEALMGTRGIQGQRLTTSHAFHSAMMDPIIPSFETLVARTRLAPPTRPFVSNVTGDWITPRDAIDPTYWGRHLRLPVKFWPGFLTMVQDGAGIVLEAGPGRSLSSAVTHAALPRLTAAPTIGGKRDADQNKPVFEAAVAQLWISGVQLDWNVIGERRAHHRVSLPTYPFERRRYWPEPNHADRKGFKRQPPATRLLHAPVWSEIELPRKVADARRILILSDASIGERLRAELAGRGDEIILVNEAEAYDDDATAGRFGVSFREPEDFGRLVHDLRSAGRLPDVVVVLSALDSVTGTSQGSPDATAAVESSFYAPLYLGAAFGDHAPDHSVSMLFAGCRMFSVAASPIAQPLAATLCGPCKVLPREYPNLTCRLLDLDDERAAHVGHIVSEIDASSPHALVAYRGGRRWVPGLAPIVVPDGGKDECLRREGVYLVTGGLGGAAFRIAEALFDRYAARLILVTRSALPPRAEWDAVLSGRGEPESAERIRALLALEARGAVVEVAACDVADAEGMTRVINEIVQRHGALHGVVHAAGVVESTSIHGKSKRDVEAIWRPKIGGAVALAAALEGHDVDFIVMLSSVAALEGGANLVAYTAANAFLDAFAASDEGPRRKISLNYDAWREVGMAAKARKAFDLDERDDGDAIDPDEAVEAFFQAVESRRRQVVITRRELFHPLRKPDPSKASQTVANDGQGHAQASTTSGKSPLSKRPMHPRPALETPFAAASTPGQIAMTEIWMDFLRVDPIGIDDDFFELGGHSILALQMLPRVRTRYSVELSPRDVWAASTVAQLVELIEERLITELEDAEHGSPASSAL